MNAKYSIRIVNVDSYMASPINNLDVMYSEFRGTSITKVPIIRIFGSTSQGQKICVHVHGVFPYFYIPYDGTENVNVMMYQVATNIDKAINISLNQGNSNTQHVYKVSLVSAFPFYGYHSKQHQFFKIYLYNPLLIRRVNNLLQKSEVLGKLYQPHETHIPFALQFMIDYNLHGMSNMLIDIMKFRRNSENKFDNNLDSDIYLPSLVSRISTCELEADISSEHILNRLEISSGKLAVNPGIAALWEDEKQRRRNKNEDSQLDSCLSLGENDAKPTKSHIVFKNALSDRLSILSTERQNEEKVTNLSVYPAETPESGNILNASTVDIQIPSSSESFNESNSAFNDIDVTITSSSDQDANISLDENALNLLNILEDLKGKNSDFEEDSILSQVVKDVADEDDLDLSMPLAAMTTPTKIIVKDDSDNDSDMWNDTFDTTIIPQLDGCGEHTPKIKKIREINKPKIDLFDTSETLNNCSTNKNLQRVKTKNLKINKKYILRRSPRIAQKLAINLEQEVNQLKNNGVCLIVNNKRGKKDRKVSVPTKLRRSIRIKMQRKLRNDNKRKIANLNMPLIDCDTSSMQDNNSEPIVKHVTKIKRENKNTLKRKMKMVLENLKQNKSPDIVATPEEQIENKTVANKKKRRILSKKLISKNALKLHILNSEKKFVEKIKISKLPIYKIVPARRVYQLSVKQKPKIKILSNIVINPKMDFSIVVKYPNNETYLYSYKNCIYPQVKKIEKPVVSSKCTEDQMINMILSQSDKSNNLLIEFCTNELKHHLNELKIESYEKVNTEYNCQNILQRYNLFIKQKHSISDKVFRESKNANNIYGKENKNTSKGSDIENINTSFSPKIITRSMANNNKITTKSLIVQASLDGAFDTSSSEEDEKRTTKKRKLSQRYKTLPVSISSPSKNGSATFEKQCSAISTHKKTEETKTTISENKRSPKKLNCDINVKRKLSFPSSPLQSTFVEEKKVCDLKQRTPHKELTKPITFPGENKSVNNLPKSDLEDVCSSSEDDVNPNKSFFLLNIKDTLSTAAKYDLETNFLPIEGSSKVSQPLSSGTLSDKLFSSGNSDISKKSLDLDHSQKPEKAIFSSSSGQNTKSLSSSLDLLPAGQASLTVNSSQSESTLIPSNNIVERNKNRVITPLIKAPTKRYVLDSLKYLNIPQVKNIQPYYSDVEDFSGSVEVGYNVLKILTKVSTHLLEFETKQDSLNVFRKSQIGSTNIKWNKTNNNNLILSQLKDRNCIITPVKKPPNKEAVKRWIIEKSQKTELNLDKKGKEEKIKIYIPLSPSGNDDEELNMSLTLTPCSPSLSQSDSSSSLKSIPTLVTDTPKSSGTRSPVLGKHPKKKRRHTKQIQESTPKAIIRSQDKLNNSCQITGTTLNNTYGFDKSTVNNLQNARAVVLHQYLTIMVVEVHVRTRSDFKPNPEYDPICGIFYSIHNDVPDNHSKLSKCKGIISVSNIPLVSSEEKIPLLDGVGLDCDIAYVDNEEELFKQFVTLISFWDPDILAGYEIEMLSWGYIINRASVIGINLLPLISRIKDSNSKPIDDDNLDDLKVTGRIVLDVWRLMRHEIALQSYSFESIVYHILHKRVPFYSFKELTFWWDHRTNLFRHRTVYFYLFRVVHVLELFDKLDLISRTSELARLFGIQFFEVLSRGSQFRVESMMLRLAKPLNYIPVSPSITQRAKMNAPEFIPLVLEPESKFYVDPVIVLDFQSLYPSIIIAYNYCFSTCIGKIERLGKNIPFEFGATQLKISKQRIEKFLKLDSLNFSPCGIGFVKPHVREGILPRMLKEILSTRLMVKNSMKENKNDSILQKVLHNRQLGLKLIANVTYGYTSANFSGRMPCVEVGDSVVSKGRETLQRAITMVENTPEWGAKVVYGDTDSLFLLLPGKSKECAFEIGKKVADAITNDNPNPIKLKFEKVYYPCILQTKKRYVGYMYESPDQKEAVYEAKGIETVRRDGCPAVSKILEKCLRLLFETKDVSLIKKYVLRQFNKILAGRVSIQDLTFAKEYRGAKGYRPGACVPALELARKWVAVDKRSEPRSGERVPYIIINGPPGVPLIRLVRSPRELLVDPSLRPNTLYYITRVIIPPLNRCLSLIGADVNAWFNQMPRKQIQVLPTSSPNKKSTISQYFSTTSCASCGEQTKTGLCEECCQRPQSTVITLMEKIKRWEQNKYEVNTICQSCTGWVTEPKCISLDCPVLYRRVQTSRDDEQATFVRQLFDNEF